MFDVGLTPILFIGLVALAIGLLAYVVASPFLTGEHKSEKRIDAISKGKANKTGARQEATTDRRKQVQEQLKYADQKKAAKNKVTLKTKLIRAGLAASPQQFHIASLILAAVGFAGCLVGGLGILTAGLVAFAAGTGLPRWILSFLAKRRQAKFSNEFANAIDVIVRGVQTGLPLNECLNIIARESPEPVKGEFVDFVEGQRLGIPMMECFERMMESIPLPEVNFFAIVVKYHDISRRYRQANRAIKSSRCGRIAGSHRRRLRQSIALDDRAASECEPLIGNCTLHRHATAVTSF